MSNPPSTRGEKTQSGNPHQLSRRLHVFPAKSIERFTRQGGVDLFDVRRRICRRARVNDVLFCADRSWNHGAESGFMKGIEDAFQVLVTDILNGKNMFNEDESDIIAEFYGLWAARVRWRYLASQDTPVGDDFLGTRVDYSKDELERLEKNHISAFRSDGTMAMRNISALCIRLEIDREREACSGRNWGVFTAKASEFCVPDVPSYGVIPVTPIIALALDNHSETLTPDEVADVNSKLNDNACEYLFARDFDKCPGLSTYCS